jgi:hypothetical protein
MVAKQPAQIKTTVRGDGVEREEPHPLSLDPGPSGKFSFSSNATHVTFYASRNNFRFALPGDVRSLEAVRRVRY